MHRAPLALLLLSAALLAACPPDGQGPGTTSGPASEAADDTTAPTTGATFGGSSTSGAIGTTEDATTASATGTTQPVDSTGLATTSTDTTSTDTTSTDTTSTDTTSEGSGTGGTGDTDDLPDTTGGELCEDGREQVDVEWSLEVPPELIGEALTIDCEIVGSTVMGPEVAVSFDCPGVQQELVLHYSVLPIKGAYVWEAGEGATLTYRSEVGAWQNEWLKVTSPSTYFRGVRADALAPPDTTIEEFHGYEVEVNAPCDPQPDACGQRQGLELRFSYAVEDFSTFELVRSGETANYGFPSQTTIWLERATRLLQPIGCADVAPLWLDFVSLEEGFIP